MAQLSSLGAAIETIAQGKMVIIVDHPDRENEGDLAMAARYATPAAINFMATHARGLVCVSMDRDRLQELEIAPMVQTNTDPNGTAFHVSVDARRRTSTGISASDRAETIRRLADPTTTPSDFNRPGHVFPLACRAGGVLERAGHTEASVDLAGLAGAGRTAIICEIARADGEMMRLPELLEFADRHQLPVISIDDLIAHRRSREQRVTRVSEARIPLAQGTFTVVGYRDLLDGREHLAAIMGDVSGQPAVLVRVHSECLTGDVFGSRRCDCGRQLELALHTIAAEGAGAVVYLRGHEGRGIGLLEKLSAYGLQDAGLDTVEANLALGHPADLRDYRAGAEILKDLGVDDVRLLTNNPAKRGGLEDGGVSVLECVPLQTAPTAENVRYLGAKRSKLGHSLEVDPVEPVAGTNV
jgi:3,4-dihydroxy 2-butanone 4-phosphate synthase/GTP cyclohydrolase II